MSFASEPGRDDGNLPPVNVVVPDDARELARDVLAYRREQRAERRRRRWRRLLRPFRLATLGGHAAIIPAIAICLAISLVGGVLLSVATMSPAAAPTTPATSPAAPAELPSGSVQLAGHSVLARSLVTSAIALIPVNCDCGAQLGGLAGQAADAHVALYFAGTGQAIDQLPALVARYGDRLAVTVADNDRVLATAYRPQGLTVLLVFEDARAEVIRTPGASFQLTAAMGRLNEPGATQVATS